VLATITDAGRMAAEQAMITYGEGVRTHYLDQLSRTQMVATGDNCRRINAGLRLAAPPRRLRWRSKPAATIEPPQENAAPA